MRVVTLKRPGNLCPAQLETWLSDADRSRVLCPDKVAKWMLGCDGAIKSREFADGSDKIRQPYPGRRRITRDEPNVYVDFIRDGGIGRSGVNRAGIGMGSWQLPTSEQPYGLLHCVRMEEQSVREWHQAPVRVNMPWCWEWVQKGGAERMRIGDFETNNISFGAVLWWRIWLSGSPVIEPREFNFSPPPLGRRDWTEGLGPEQLHAVRFSASLHATVQQGCEWNDTTHWKTRSMRVWLQFEDAGFSPLRTSVPRPLWLAERQADVPRWTAVAITWRRDVRWPMGTTFRVGDAAAHALRLTFPSAMIDLASCIRSSSLCVISGSGLFCIREHANTNGERKGTVEGTGRAGKGPSLQSQSLMGPVSAPARKGIVNKLPKCPTNQARVTIPIRGKPIHLLSLVGDQLKNMADQARTLAQSHGTSSRQTQEVDMRERLEDPTSRVRISTRLYGTLNWWSKSRLVHALLPSGVLTAGLRKGSVGGSDWRDAMVDKWTTDELYDSNEHIISMGQHTLGINCMDSVVEILIENRSKREDDMLPFNLDGLVIEMDAINPIPVRNLSPPQLKARQVDVAFKGYVESLSTCEDDGLLFNLKGLTCGATEVYQDQQMSCGRTIWFSWRIRLVMRYYQFDRTPPGGTTHASLLTRAWNVKGFWRLRSMAQISNPGNRLAIQEYGIAYAALCANRECGTRRTDHL
ncbi:uncharacterized protein EI90DRAFT_3016753 [Cantharellus anzutake]|uniref:uncharacterized protein n=1 Tax=Cantharellus anzutake TaxID=1750568 RepID=UPI001904B274|nr:uncharacterized protein EI90DRAFT_3016753 [Cantharellus anzutake]KAF8330598.1 hypothetical protein EI90DRAFT_3016753 [Cantharellus anzutake]